VSDVEELNATEIEVSTPDDEEHWVMVVPIAPHPRVALLGKAELLFHADTAPSVQATL
jgi:hypothetical protein